MHHIDPTLEGEYNNRARVPDHPQIFDRWRKASARFRDRANATLDLPYGPAGRHRLDLFHAASARGTVVFIHGGYWRSLDKSDFSFVAAPFVDAGLSVAAFNYRFCPQASLAEVVADCRQALAWLLRHGAAHHMPLDRIALTGHSAGGHLVAMLLATDWSSLGIDARRIVGGAALSGVYNLSPLLQVSMNADLRLDPAQARMLSPVMLQPAVPAPLHLAVGADDSEAFRQQSRDLQLAWPGCVSACETVDGCNHFTIVDYFVQPGSNAFQSVAARFD